MYQASVSQHDTRLDFSSQVADEAEVRSVPGGLASVRRRFESEEISSARTVGQFHVAHTPVKPLCELSSGRQDERAAHENQQNESAEEENYPRLSTKELAQHFEKTIEDAAPSKKIKIERDVSRLQLTSDARTFSSSTAHKAESRDTGGSCFTYNTEDDLDYLPPPPPDLLEEPLEYPEELPEPPMKTTMNREQYFRQRELLELKRLCKHIHPEVRKDLERDFYNDGNEMDEELEAIGDVQEAAFQFEQSGGDSNTSPDREYLEWDEILRGEVQSVRWMFENKPLDCIRNASSDEDEETRKMDIVPGGDVRSTALLFETQPMDSLGLEHDSTKPNYLVNEVGKRDVRAAAWMFETKPMDSLNKIKADEPTKEVIFTQEATEGVVKSVRYIFENQEMDSLGDTETMDEKQLLSLKSVLEEIKSDVKKVIWMFETQCMCMMREHSGEMVLITSVRREETEKGEVKTSRWLFETQPLRTIDKDLSQIRLISSVSMEDNKLGEARRGRWLFETKRLDSISAQWERLQKQHKEEILGADVRKHCLVFETQPMDTLKDASNSRPVTTEQIIGGNVRSVRHMFESAPLEHQKELPEVGRLRKTSTLEDVKEDVRHQQWVFEKKQEERIKAEEDEVSRLQRTSACDDGRADVKHQKWLFETQHLEDIREEKKELIKTIDSEHIDRSYKGDVRKNCWVFETQPMDRLKDDSNARPPEAEEILRGDVQSARQFFEMAPKDEMKELAEVGKLKRTMTPEERGDVRHQRWLFESQPLEQIREERKETARTVNIEDIENVDVSNYKQIFEMSDLSQYNESQKIQVEGVTTGSVRSNKHLFESVPLYALQDRSGHYHEVRTVRREEIISGDVRSCQWMFETRPVDQFDESIAKYQIIRGITQQEVESGDVKTAKWLFETQPLDAIKYFSNIEDEEDVLKESAEIVKGDVKTCKWLFETKPIDMLYDREALQSKSEACDVQKGDVKSCTWLFETQNLGSIQSNTETVLQTRTVKEEDIQGKDVSTARFLFETEKLENITGEGEAFKTVTEIDILSGDVSRMKYIFETQSSDAMSSTSEEIMRQMRNAHTENIQKGNVENCKWLFENQPIDAISVSPDDLRGNCTVQDVQRGDVNKGRFIFETFSLDQIVDPETERGRLQKVMPVDEEKGDVKTYAMMFETQPLYAIQDKDGHYHEVTTMTKEEIQRGDVVGTRWLFETKPLDLIRETSEVYLLKGVTQEDIQKGDVSSARWKFETQPLDTIADNGKVLIKTVEDIKGGDVKTNTQRFESDTASQNLVRTVSMSEIHKGDVRKAKWMFETHSIDQLHDKKDEDELQKVVMEEHLKGDVRQSVWLFEKSPLDLINESDENRQVLREDIPKADVKTTTWLFETTPMTKFNESSLEKNEIIGKSVKTTLDELYSQSMVDSKGIIIEADEIGDVRMAKYNLMSKEAPQIQKEEIIRGDLQSIMMNLLNRQETTERGIIINAEEHGNISGTVQQLLHQHSDSTVEKEEIIRGDIQEAINNLLKTERARKRGILIQEDEKGDVRMTIYSLFNSHEESGAVKENVVKGNVKDCLERLCNPEFEEIARIKVDEAERGKVSFYSTCIESGALDYLKKLQVEPGETNQEEIEKEEIIGGDIAGTKLSLKHNQVQIGRLVDREDIVPGDVHNTVRVFMTEPPISFDCLEREEIVRGDLKAALTSLNQSVNQTVVLEKEEVVRGDINTTLRSLEEAQNQAREVEKPDIIPGDIKGALKSLKDSACYKVEIAIEDLVSGDIKGTLRSLEEAKHAVREVERETIVKGDVHTAIESLKEASNERREKVCQQDVDVQGDVKGKIQLLLETPSSPRMQRRASTEGDVKLSIKSLYDTQEQVQLEKEEVIKGDVKGTIKSLMETAQRASPTIPRREPIRKVKVHSKTPSQSKESTTHSVKNLSMSQESWKSAQTTAAEFITTEEISNQDMKTIIQTHGVKTLKTDFRNLKKGSCKGLIRVERRKNKQDKCLPPPEPESPLPPPPSPPPDYDIISFSTPPPNIRGDHDLPLPPTPPPPNTVCDSGKMEHDHLPPPPTPPLPPPPTADQDVLPPPPTEQELSYFPSLSKASKARKTTVTPMKAPALCKVPKLEPPILFDKTDSFQSGKMLHNVKAALKSSVTTPEIFSKQPPESPRPPKKVFAPVTLTPPASPPPCKSPVSKFKTPLIQAEQKFRQQREESCTPPRSPAFEIRTHESVSAALEMLSTQRAETVQSEKSISFDFTQESIQKTMTKSESATASCDSSQHTGLSITSRSEALIAGTAEKSPPESQDISTVKQNIITNQPSQSSPGQQQTTSTSVRKKKKRSTTTCIRQVTETKTEFTQQSENVHLSNQTDYLQHAPQNESVSMDFISIHTGDEFKSEEKRQAIISPELPETIGSPMKETEQNAPENDNQNGTTKISKLEKAAQENIQVKENSSEAKKSPVNEPPATPKKKRRSKNKKVQGNNTSTASAEVTLSESKCSALIVDKRSETSVVHTQQAFHAGRAEAVSSERQFQQKEIFQMHLGESHQILEKSSDESQSVCEIMAGCKAESTAESSRLAEAQAVMSRIAELQRGKGKTDFESTKTLLCEMPTWLLDPKQKSDLESECSKESNMEVLTQVKDLIQGKMMHLDGCTFEKHECEATSERFATQRISKITIGSTKTMKEEKKIHKSRRKQNGESKTLNARSPSPSLRLRSSSPTFITIESTKRTDSPHGNQPPTPPPRRSETPSSRRADSLTRLRNATAALSRGASPDPVPHVARTSKKKSEIVESPSTFHRQINIDSKSARDTVSLSSSENTKLSEETQKVHEMHGDSIISTNSVCYGFKHGGTESETTEEMESRPGVDRKIETSAEKFVKNGSFDKTKTPDRESKDLELDPENKEGRQEERTAFNFKDIKNVFETSEQSSSIKALRNKQEEQESRVSQIASEGSKLELPPERKRRSQLSAEEKVGESADPTGFSQTKTVTEHYSAVDEFSSTIIRSKSTATVSQHSLSVPPPAPFSYADAVRKKSAPEAFAEEPVRNLPRAWTESEDSSAKVGAVCGVQAEGVSDGRSGSRQKEVP